MGRKAHGRVRVTGAGDDLGQAEPRGYSVRGLSFPWLLPLNLSGAQEAEGLGTSTPVCSGWVWGGCALPAAGLGILGVLSPPQPCSPGPKSSPGIQIRASSIPQWLPLRKRGQIRCVITGTRSFLSHKHMGSPLWPAGPGH